MIVEKENTSHSAKDGVDYLIVYMEKPQMFPKFNDIELSLKSSSVFSGKEDKEVVHYCYTHQI